MHIIIGVNGSLLCFSFFLSLGGLKVAVNLVSYRGIGSKT